MAAMRLSSTRGARPFVAAKMARPNLLRTLALNNAEKSLMGEVRGRHCMNCTSQARAAPRRRGSWTTGHGHCMRCYYVASCVSHAAGTRGPAPRLPSRAVLAAAVIDSLARLWMPHALR
jgi:hypothetical protein